MTARHFFEDEPRWPGGPKHCLHANLPAFATKQESRAFNEANGKLPILAEWCCNVCQHWHHYCGAEVDTNGQCVAGGDKIPDDVQRLIRQAAKS